MPISALTSYAKKQKNVKRYVISCLNDFIKSLLLRKIAGHVEMDVT